MSNPWDHLPNAKHIDRVLDHAAARPEAWMEASRAEAVINGTGWAALGKATSDITRRGAWVAVWKVASSPDLRLTPRGGLRDALLALIVYDDCGHMLDFTPEQIHLYACLNIPAAKLLESAINAMNQRLT